MSRFARRARHLVLVLVLTLVVVALWVPLARATTVTPSSAVTHYVVVRAGPSTQSARKGKLFPGAQAVVLESVPHWLKVKLTDGIVGYVSKSWVTESAAPEPAGGGSGVTPTATPISPLASAPSPVLSAGHPTTWWFVFKFNAAAFPDCGGGARQC